MVNGAFGNTILRVTAGLTITASSLALEVVVAVIVSLLLPVVADAAGDAFLLGAAVGGHLAGVVRQTERTYEIIPLLMRLRLGRIIGCGSIGIRCEN